MKNAKTIFTTLSLVILLAFVSCEKEIHPTDAPPAIKSYVNTHFSDCEIQKITRDKENGVKSYDVTLNCGVNIEFEEGDRLQVIDINSSSKLPDGVIQNEQLEYVNSHFENNYIIGWEYEAHKTKQHIELNTKKVLEFDANNNFIKIVKNN